MHTRRHLSESVQQQGEDGMMTDRRWNVFVLSGHVHLEDGALACRRILIVRRTRPVQGVLLHTLAPGSVDIVSSTKTIPVKFEPSDGILVLVFHLLIVSVFLKVIVA